MKIPSFLAWLALVLAVGVASGAQAQEEVAATSAAAATCTEPAKPSMPDGKTATEEQMLDAQGEVKAYIAEGESYMDCLKGLEQSVEEEDEEKKAALIQAHNAMVDSMEAVAGQFNEQVAAFSEQAK